MRGVMMVAALLAIGACTSNPGEVVGVDEEFRLRVGESVHVVDADFNLRFVKVNSDSRCPIDVVCIQIGNAQVQLELETPGADTHLILNTADEPRQIVAGPHRIELVALLPGREASRPFDQDDYEVVLAVRPNYIVCTAEARAALAVTLSDSLSGSTSGFTGDACHVDTVSLTARLAR